MIKLLFYFSMIKEYSKTYSLSFKSRYVFDRLFLGYLEKGEIHFFSPQFTGIHVTGEKGINVNLPKFTWFHVKKMFRSGTVHNLKNWGSQCHTLYIWFSTESHNHILYKNIFIVKSQKSILIVINKNDKNKYRNLTHYWRKMQCKYASLLWKLFENVLIKLFWFYNKLKS